MLKKIGTNIVFVFCFVVLIASTSRSAMQWLSDARDMYKKDVWWGVHQNNHGDLASISHLDYLNKFNLSDKRACKRAAYNGPKKTVLFLHGDSNCLGLADSVFAGICSFIFIGWSNPYKYHLDTTKNNILVIETGERILCDYYNSTQIIDQLHDTGSTQNAGASLLPGQSQTIYSSFAPDIKFDYFFNKYINQNLEFNLFNYNFMMPLFGVKAAINFYLFDRASGDAVISKDKQFLFFKETMSTTAPGSSFSSIDTQEIAHLVHNFNAIYEYYKASGFKEIYLSIVPNTVTIMQPEGYNNFIPLIQNDSRLKIKIIDVYSVFKKSKDVLFLHGDTHWNPEGKQIWVDMVNDVLVHSMDNAQ